MGEVRGGSLPAMEPEVRQSVRDIRPVTRCMECDEPLRAASKGEVRSRVPPHIAADCDEFQECARCKRVYWQGCIIGRYGGGSKNWRGLLGTLTESRGAFHPMGIKARSGTPTKARRAQCATFRN